MEKIKDKNLVTESILKITWVYKDFLPPLGRPLGSVQVPTGPSPVGLSTLCLPTQHCLYFRDFPPSLYRTSVYLPVYPSVWQYKRARVQSLGKNANMTYKNICYKKYQPGYQKTQKLMLILNPLKKVFKEVISIKQQELCGFSSFSTVRKSSRRSKFLIWISVLGIVHWI